MYIPQLCVVFSFLGVSIVLYIVSRFSPHEWRPMTVMTPNNNFSMPTQTITTHQTTSVNEFTLLNSFWFAIAALMQQGCDFTPRSLPGILIYTTFNFFFHHVHSKWKFVSHKKYILRSHNWFGMVVFYSHIDIIVHSKFSGIFNSRTYGHAHQFTWGLSSSNRRAIWNSISWIDMGFLSSK
jgi:hypothetical protein